MRDRKAQEAMPQLVAAWDRAMWLEVVAEPFAAPRPVLRRRSVLEPPANEDTIATAEERIGLRLPPSYRAFLTRSDGAYAGPTGLQHRHPTDPPRPLALLPAAAIDRSLRWFSGWPVDELVLEGSEPLPHGGDALFAPSPPGHHSGLTDLATHLAGRSPEFRLGHLCRSITIGLDAAETLVLDPTVRDGDGEWAVWTVSSEGCGPFHPSFAHWLRWRTETGTIEELDTAELIDAVVEPGATVWGALSALTTLIQRRERLAWVEKRLTRILRRSDDHRARRRALVLCRSLDLVDGGDRFGAWTAAVMADDDFADVEVLSLVDHRVDSAPAPPTPTRPGTPTAADVADAQRRADLAHLSDVSTETLAGRYRRDPDPIVGHFLAQRGHPAVVDGALGELLRMADDVDHWLPNGPFPTAPDPTVAISADELIAAAHLAGEEYHLVRPINTGLAMARAGHLSEAVEYLHGARSGLEGFRLLYPIAEIDIPRSWEILDEAARTHPEHATTVNTTGLLAAARTRSPLLAERAVQLIDDGAAVAPIALLALELQVLPAAADALLALWHRGHLGALRALARRGDHRVLDDCRLLLADPHAELRQVGAETLRDLGHPGTIELLTSGVGLDEQPLMVALQADALVAMGVPAAAPALDRAASRIDDPDLARVLTVWADQLRRRGQIDDRRHRGS
ncbi:MAG: SMI1/KNR4 family protein [Actinomycetota bacterium]